MIFQKKSVILKNGTVAIFRSPTKEDAEQMLEYLKTTCSETDFLTREPEEANIPIESEQKFLDNISNSSNDLMIACEIDGKIIGNCNLNRYSQMRTKHRAGIGIAICKDYWGLGIGKLLLKELIHIATEQGIKQLELEVINKNERAIRLYEKAGFVKVGEKPNALCLKDGTMLNEILMVKKL